MMTRFYLKPLKERFLLGFKCVGFLAALYGAQLLLPHRVYGMEQSYQPPIASEAPIATKGEGMSVMDWQETLAHKPSQASSGGSGMISTGEDPAQGSGRLSQSLSLKSEDKDLLKATSIKPRPQTVVEEPCISFRLDEQSAHSVGFKGKDKLVDTPTPQIPDEVPTETYADRAITYRGSHP